MSRRREILGPAGLLVVLAAAAATYRRSLHTAPNFDEAGYSAALDALRHGQQLGTEVYLVQPPGFYFLLEGIATAFGDQLADLRTGMLLISLVGLAAAYAIGRRYGGVAGGIGAAALLAVSPPYPAFAPLVESDPPSVVLGLVALALAAWSYGPRRERPERPWLAAAAGVALACSILVKLFTGTIFLPLVALAIRNRTSRRTLAATAAGGLAVLALLVVTHLGAVDDFWRGAVSGQLANRNIEAPSHLDNLERVVRFFDPRTPGTYVALAGILAAVVQGVRHRRLGMWPLWSWSLAAAAFTVWMRPLLDHHLVLLAAAIAVPAGTSAGAALMLLRPRARLVLAGATVLVLAAGLAQQWRQLGENVRAEEPAVVWAAGLVRANTPPDGYVVSDLPYVAVLADRRIPGPLVDTSWGRVISGKLSAADVVRVADEYDVDVVVTGRMLLSSPGLAELLRDRFPVRRRYGDTTVYLR